MNKRVGILMGGPSREREISIKSGMAVYQALENKGIETVPIELSRASAMNGYRGAVIDKVRSSNIDIAFIALHGRFGEDGHIQEILEEMNIPYTGSGVSASRQGIDKIKSREIFRSKNIPVPRYEVIARVARGSTLATSCFEKLGSPLVIKPSDEGSSIGLSIVDSERDLAAGVDNAFNYSDNVIIEEYLYGRELTVGIIGDDALPVVEIIPKRKFFDFDAKYKNGLTEYKVPADIKKNEYEACQKTALMAHNALGARFFSRVDMILNDKGVSVVLELNSIPGLTHTSLLPKAAQAAGIDFEKLVLKILESALW
jgi:D-alanine--D-alanine ligase